VERRGVKEVKKTKKKKRSLQGTRGNRTAEKKSSEKKGKNRQKTEGQNRCELKTRDGLPHGEINPELIPFGGTITSTTLQGKTVCSHGG